MLLSQIDFTGNTFGRLLVIEPLFVRRGRFSSIWICECLCKDEDRNEVRTELRNLRHGYVQSCGCMRLEGVTSHGLRHSSEYSSWHGMKQRCYNPKHPSYDRYGGRGITVCDEWREDFEAFYRDMGPKPTHEHSIERRENDKGYSKENCVWATKAEQIRNRSNSVYYEHDGKKKILIDWCQELGLNYGMVQSRLNKGVSFEEAISRPKRQVLTHTRDGETKSLLQWCNELGLKYGAVDMRIRRGASIQEALGLK